MGDASWEPPHLPGRNAVPPCAAPPQKWGHPCDGRRAEGAWVANTSELPDEP